MCDRVHRYVGGTAGRQAGRPANEAAGRSDQWLSRPPMLPGMPMPMRCPEPSFHPVGLSDCQFTPRLCQCSPRRSQLVPVGAGWRQLDPVGAHCPTIGMPVSWTVRGRSRVMRPINQIHLTQSVVLWRTRYIPLMLPPTCKTCYSTRTRRRPPRPASAQGMDSRSTVSDPPRALAEPRTSRSKMTDHGGPLVRVSNSAASSPNAWSNPQPGAQRRGRALSIATLHIR